MSGTDDGHPIYVFLIGDTPPQYLELTIQAIKYIKRSVKNAKIGIISPPGGQDLTETVVNRLKEINPKADTENIHWVEGRAHFDDWDNTQRILDIEEFTEEFDPIIFLDSDSVVLGDVLPTVHDFLQSEKKFGFINSYIPEYPTFNQNWSGGSKFIPKTSFQLYRAAAVVELLPIWKKQWKTWVEPAPFVENKNPARFYKNSKITIGQYALSKALTELNPNFDEIVYEIPNHSVKVNGNFGLSAQKTKRKFLGAGSSFSNDGPATVTLKVKSAKLNESGDPYVATKVGDWTRKTKTIHGTDEPVWDQEFIFENSSYGEANTINFTLWNNPEPEPAPKTRSFGGAYTGPAKVTLDIISGTIHGKHDVVGEDDPYVKVSIGGVVKQTKYKKDTQKPQWDETLTWDDVTSDAAQEITITVWDWDKFTKHDLIGTATLDLLPYNNNKQHVTVSLTDGGKEEAVIEIDAIVEPAEAPEPVATRSYAAPVEPTTIGTATLSLLDKKVTEPSTPASISLPIVGADGEEKGTLEVDAEFLVPQLPEEEEEQPKARSFAAPSWTGPATVSIDVISGVVHGKHDVVGEDDPYVKIKIGAIEKQTKHIPNTSKPRWNQNITFTDVTPQDGKNVTITAWDWDKFTKHDLIGTATLNLLQYVGTKGHASVSVVDKKGKEEGTIEIDVQVTPNV